MIQENLLKYEYELKPLTNDFHASKGSDIALNDVNVRIYCLLRFFLYMCMYKE